MRAWINGELLSDPSAPAVAVVDHGLTVGDGVFEAIKVVDGLPFALTRHLDRLARSAAGLGLPDARRGRRTPRGRGGPGRPGPAAGPDPDHLHRRARARWAPAAATRPPTLVVVADAMGAWPAADGGRDGAVAAQRAGRAGRPEDHVVRRERGRAGLRRRSAGRARRSSPTWPGTCARAPGRTSSTSSTGELRTPTLASGCLAGVTRALVLEWFGGAEVDEPIEVHRAGQRGVPGLDDARRAGRRRAGTTASCPPRAR